MGLRIGFASGGNAADASLGQARSITKRKEPRIEKTTKERAHRLPGQKADGAGVAYQETAPGAGCNRYQLIRLPLILEESGEAAALARGSSGSRPCRTVLLGRAWPGGMHSDDTGTGHGPGKSRRKGSSKDYEACIAAAIGPSDLFPRPHCRLTGVRVIWAPSETDSGRAPCLARTGLYTNFFTLPSFGADCLASEL